MNKSKFISVCMVISFLLSISDCQSMSHVGPFIRISGITAIATGLVYIPLCGIYLLKGTEKALLNALEPAIWGGAGLMASLSAWANIPSDCISPKDTIQYIISNKLLFLRSFGAIGATTYGLLKLNKFLKEKYG